jgi:hypothetical protein
MAWLPAKLVAWLIACCAFLAAPWLRAENDTQGSDESIHRWIDELESDLFIVRERATRDLLRAGRPAIAPLAAAAESQDLEVATRAARVLLELTEQADDQTALLALQELAQLKNRPVERKAAQGILASRREKAALAELVRLGAQEMENARYLVDGQHVTGHLILSRSAWKGGDEGLRLLRDLPSLRILSVHGAKISDTGLAYVHEVTSLERIDLFGTQVTDRGIADLKQKLPQAMIDRRRGAFLGVQGFDQSEMAQITHVMEGSAAEKAGIMQGDVVVKFNGDVIKGFQSLTRQIAQFEPGDKAVVEVLREGQVLTHTVTFGHW